MVEVEYSQLNVGRVQKLRWNGERSQRQDSRSEKKIPNFTLHIIKSRDLSFTLTLLSAFNKNVSHPMHLYG
jgi:hypothetical protein